MTLIRIVIAAQIAAIALVGVAVAGSLTRSPWQSWSEGVAVLVGLPTLVGFPLAVMYSARRSPMRVKAVLVVLELALTAAAAIAFLPLVQ